MPLFNGGDQCRQMGNGAKGGWHRSSYASAMMDVSDINVAAGSPVAEENLANLATSSRPVKVWLVDDNDRLRMTVAEALGCYKNIQCARHFSGPDALLSELASKPGPDVILLDVQMGERSGLDAVRPIKSLTRSTRVLMFTSCNDSEWRERAMRDGASDYLLKGCGLERMAERICCPANDPPPRTYHSRRPRESSEQGRRNSTPSGPWLWRRTLDLLQNVWPAHDCNPMPRR